MYKTTNRARPDQDTRPTHDPARVAGGLPFCYNVQHVKSAKAPIADCFSSGRLVNFMRESALRGDLYCVPSYAFPFGHTSRLRRDHAGEPSFACLEIDDEHVKEKIWCAK